MKHLSVRLGNTFQFILLLDSIRVGGTLKKKSEQSVRIHFTIYILNTFIKEITAICSSTFLEHTKLFNYFMC